MNCIKEGIIPTKYFEKTKEGLKSANGSNLNIQYKLSDICIENQNVFYKISFLLVKDLTTDIILGTSFIGLLKPFMATDEGITTKTLNQEIIFKFISKPKEKIINFLNKEVNNLISDKWNQIKFLKEEINYKKIEERLEDPYIKRKIQDIEKEIAQTICAEIPNAFWQRKQHTISLPYEKDFKEENIPTKA